MTQNTPSPDPRSLRVLPWLVAIAFFMSMLDVSILNTALPAIAKSMDASPLRMHSVVVAYTLTVATLIPASGWLADRFGARRVFLGSIILFTLGSLACALSSNLDMLVAARVFQGAGGALMTPVGRLSVMRAFPRDQIARIFSFVIIPGLLGPLLGPALGGLLVHYATWEWIFLINIPVGVLGAVLTVRHMPNYTMEDQRGSFDWLGFLLFASSMVLITLSLESMGEEPLPRSTKILLALAGFSCLAGYALHALRAKRPLFTLALFRTRNFSAGILGNIFSRLGMGAMPFLAPLMLQVSLGYTPLKAGLSMIPITLGAILGRCFVNKLLETLGYRRLLVVNTVLVGLSLAAFALITPATPGYGILGLLLLSGTLNSLQFTGMSTITLLDLPDEQTGGGNSLFSSVLQLSMGMGIALASAFLDMFTGPNLEGVLAAFHNTFLVLGAITALSSCIFFHTRDTKGYSSSAKRQEEDLA